MKKVVIQCSANSEHGDFSYSAEVLSDSYEAERYERDGHCVVDISEERALQWAEFLNKQKEWNEYWEKLDDEFWEGRSFRPEV